LIEPPTVAAGVVSTQPNGTCLSAILRSSNVTSTRDRELGKHCRTGRCSGVAQVRGLRQWPLLTAGDRCRPLLGARRGHGREGPNAAQPSAMAPARLQGARLAPLCRTCTGERARVNVSPCDGPHLTPSIRSAGSLLPTSGGDDGLDRIRTTDTPWQGGRRPGDDATVRYRR
jgi:hypothetical protein